MFIFCNFSSVRNNNLLSCIFRWLLGVSSFYSKSLWFLLWYRLIFSFLKIEWAIIYEWDNSFLGIESLRHTIVSSPLFLCDELGDQLTAKRGERLWCAWGLMSDIIKNVYSKFSYILWTIHDPRASTFNEHSPTSQTRSFVVKPSTSIWRMGGSLQSACLTTASE